MRSSLRSLLLVGAVVLVGCSGTDVASPSTTTIDVAAPDDSTANTGTLDPDALPVPADVVPGFDDLPVLDDITLPGWEPATRTDELAVALGSGEEPTVQQAVDAFSIQYGPMPGATPTDLSLGDGVGPTYALALIESVRDRLAPQQLAVLGALDDAVSASATIRLDGEIDSASTSTTVSDSASSTTSADPGVPTSTDGLLGGLSGLRAVDRVATPTVAQLTPILVQVIADWKVYRPDFVIAKVGIELDLMTTAAGKADMDAFPLPGGDLCRIRVFPRLLESGADDVTYQTAFAHEIFHCFQFRWGGPSGIAGVPGWVVEGSASFASFDLYRRVRTPVARYTFTDWWTASARPLAARTYDAWPLFESYRQAGADPYDSIERAVVAHAPSTPTTLIEAGLSGIDFRSWWSSMSLRSTNFPDSTWMMQWPAPAGTNGPRDNQLNRGTRGLGRYTVTGTGEWSQQQALVTMNDDVGLVTVVPSGELMSTHTAIGTSNIPQLTARRFCFDEGKCTCPDGTTFGSPMAGREMVFSFAAAGNAPAAVVGAEKWSAKKYCKNEKPSKRSTSNGDPHLVTFDGRPYDVMALGEFVNARDPDGGFEVQTRHEPFSFGGAGSSAVAIGTGEHRITFTGALLAELGEQTIRVDGESIGDATDVEVGDGVTATYTNEEFVGSTSSTVWIVAWPDGTAVRVRWVDGWFVTVDAPADRAGRLVGLLGASNDDLHDDLLFPDGTPLPPGPQQEIDERFAPAWQVDDDTTLFDYEPGQSPATFVQPVVPIHDVPTTDQLDACATALGDQAADHEVESCAYDVAVTGDDTFIDAYASEVDARVDAEPNPFVVVRPSPGTSGNGTDPSAGGADGADLTLAGSIYSGIGLVSDDDAVAYLDGSLDIAEGAVVVARSSLCLPDVDVTATLRLRGAEDSTTIYVCDPYGFNDTGLDGRDEMVDGEAYAWIPEAGVYDVSVSTSADDPFAAAVDFWTDADPTVADLDEVRTDGFTTTMSGIADTVVLTLRSPDAMLDLDFAGLDVACNRYAYGSDPLGSGVPYDLSFCGHVDSLGVTPSGDLETVFVVFLRTAGPTEITLGPGSG